jgi:hypothetical protein
MLRFWNTPESGTGPSSRLDERFRDLRLVRFASAAGMAPVNAFRDASSV